jgi:hypothetical protein
MQLLTVLVLIFGVAVLMAAALLALSYGLGHYIKSREGARADATDKDPCAQCTADQGWYITLPLWKQNALIAWWWANRLLCSMKGCK